MRRIGGVEGEEWRKSQRERRKRVREKEAKGGYGRCMPVESSR